MDLSGKIALVTGANKGIGLALVKQLCQAGARVHGICRSGCSYSHPSYTCHHADVRVWEQLQAVIEDIGQVDVLINNAGLGYFGLCEDMEIGQWDEMMDTNVKGMFMACKCVLPGMKTRGMGHIVNIASTAGLEGYVQVSAYCATKFAVRGFSDALYKEVREHGVKVTCVYPGSVKTDFFRHNEAITPHDNMLMPEDVAAQIVYALQTPVNFHNVNIEIRPLKPRG